MQNEKSSSSLILLIVVCLMLGGIASISALFDQRQTTDEALAVAEKATNLAQVATDKLVKAQGGDPSKVEDAIRVVLQTQQELWNAGDIDRFMEFYWKSDDLTFSSGGKVVRGWQDTLERYQQRYATREQMGTLAFSDLEVSALGPNAALVLGKWHLAREADDLGGNFTLVFRQFDGEWLIVHDHTSTAE